MVNSIKGKLLLVLLAFIVLSIISALYTAFHYNQKEASFAVSELIDEAEIELLRCFKEQENYFNFELSQDSYFETGKSEYLKAYQLSFQNLQEKIAQVETEIEEKEVEEELHKLEKLLVDFNFLFEQMQSSILKRGFRDYGIEGEMRTTIHLLEDIPEIPLEDILMLRRHEKDYILRQKEIYLEKHKKLIYQILEELEIKQFTSAERKTYIVESLQNYAHSFSQLAMYERIIGLKANSGYKHKLNQKTNQLIQQAKQIKLKHAVYQKATFEKLEFSFIFFWLAYLLSATWLSLKISDRFTKRLTKLSSQINYFVNSNFTIKLAEEFSQNKDEIGVLWNNFKKMEAEIVDYIELFKEKVDEKTFELLEKTEKIEKQKTALEKQKALAEVKNKELTDGIKYGWRIQQALLPKESRVQKQIEQGFLLFMPKDVVSGDVYWTHKIKSKKGSSSIFSVIDCTGHGVPGAFMSILALNAIEDAVLNKKLRSPAEILQSANDFVFSSLKYYNNEGHENLSKDGMELGFCSLNREQKELLFSAANRPLYLVRKKEANQIEIPDLNVDTYSKTETEEYMLFQINPSKLTLGTVKNSGSSPSQFTCQSIKVKKGDMIYLSSDGFADQFGGKRNKKFMTKRLKQLLIDIHPLEESEQKAILKQRFLSWKGKEEQIDDVCLLGVRV